MNLKALVTFAACGVLASAALGQTGQISLVSRNGEAGGGVFNWTGQFGNFQSFCVELNEFLPGNPYNASLNFDGTDSFAVGGGRNGAGANGDPLSEATARVYASFLDGSLSTFVDGTAFSGLNTRERNSAVQLAIWVLEEEAEITLGAAPTAKGSFVSAGDPGNALNYSDADIIRLADAIINEANSGLIGDNGWTQVRIINLTTLDGRAAQDMLILIPLPQTAALAGLGLAGVAVRRRRG